MVSARTLLRAALSLITAFFATAALYLLFRMEFVALAQVMVYIGGIVVFMVITILLTAQLGAKKLAPKSPGQRFFGLMVSGLLFMVLWLASLGFDLEPGPEAGAEDGGAIAAVGERLMSPEVGGFVVPFEVTALLLLAAIIGAVVIARRNPDQAAAGADGKIAVSGDAPATAGLAENEQSEERA